MATWRDGPEYAPQERPEGFVQPVAAPLSVAPAPLPAAPVPPGAEPSFARPPQPTPDLAALFPAALPGRDPRRPFEVVSAALTSPGPAAWGAAHTVSSPWAPPTGEPVVAASAWSPVQPFPAPAPRANSSIPAPAPSMPSTQFNPQPFPSQGQPGPAAPPPNAPAQVSLAQVWRATTPALVITLAVGAIISWLSLVMLGLAFFLAGRVAYRRPLAHGIVGIALGLAALIGTVGYVLDDFYPSTGLDVASTVAQLACWVVPFAVGLSQAVAITRGERPGE